MFGPQPHLLREGRDPSFSIEAARMLIEAGFKPDEIVARHTHDAGEGLLFINYKSYQKIICNPLQWADIITAMQKHYHPEWFRSETPDNDIIKLRANQ